jgi:hypothetical protein
MNDLWFFTTDADSNPVLFSAPAEVVGVGSILGPMIDVNLIKRILCRSKSFRNNLIFF